MTDEELDQARAKEAYRLWSTGHSAFSWGATAARLAREGWVPADPLVLEAREICAKSFESYGCRTAAAAYRAGDWDQTTQMVATLDGLKRGIEIGRAEHDAG